MGGEGNCSINISYLTHMMQSGWVIGTSRPTFLLSKDGIKEQQLEESTHSFPATAPVSGPDKPSSPGLRGFKRSPCPFVPSQDPTVQVSGNT